ncbi:hypothetical protein [Massilia sp.]|uniref:hypothetical protein n=1 Tax=Massilia sp. TaxID=1882437 RepID=UPI00352D05C1
MMSDGLQTTWMRDALSWVTDWNHTGGTSKEASKPIHTWIWEAIQGDFNRERSGGQIAFDAAISFIPGVDQICDIRDLVADCRQLNEDIKDGAAWLSLTLTLIGLFPSLGSLVKGALKIIFLFVRKHGVDHLILAIDKGMTWLITYLRKREVQQYLNHIKVDEVFHWLAKKVREVIGKVNKQALLSAFDRAIGVLKNLLAKVEWMPKVGDRAQATYRMVLKIRKEADQYITHQVEPLQKILDAFARRLEAESITARSGILNAGNVHFRGTLPEADAVSLLQKHQPKWLTKKGAGPWFPPLDPASPILMSRIQAAVKDGFPDILGNGQVDTFSKITKKEIAGPARIYRILSPSSAGASHCWVSEEVFLKLMRESDPKAAWRKYLAVWPDWNANGQYVLYEVKKGDTLKVWEGPAASQVKKKGKAGANHDLPDHYLEGGWDQIVFYPHSPPGQPYALMDETRFYERNKTDRNLTDQYITHSAHRALSDLEKTNYEGVRAQIKHPNILGPFDTGWGMTDFDEQLSQIKLGLPALPGQVTNH